MYCPWLWIEGCPQGSEGPPPPSEAACKSGLHALLPRDQGRKPTHTWHQARPRAVWERASNRGEWPFLYKRSSQSSCTRDDPAHQASLGAPGQHKGCTYQPGQKARPPGRMLEAVGNALPLVAVQPHAGQRRQNRHNYLRGSLQLVAHWPQRRLSEDPVPKKRLG